MWKKTLKQKEACNILNQHDHGLLYGGARSTKTAIIVRNIILRALKAENSRHLMFRLRFNHAKASLWYDTIPRVFEGFFPNVRYTENKTDWFITTPNKSQIWIGGIDDKARVEKILGTEFATIFANECSQISYDAITTMRTRLAQNIGLKLRFYYDLNPCGKKHWTYEEFIKKVIPGTQEPSQLNSGFLLMNPIHNPHLPDAYIRGLEALPKRKRQRFLEGVYVDDIEGALWTDEMMSAARTKQCGRLIRIVVAVDPAVTYNKNSDEIGIVVCALDENKYGVVIADYTIKATTATWAKRVVNVYNKHHANAVVAEVNQGGDLVEDVIKNLDRSIKVIKVHASHGKKARAEPISELYELGKVAHISDMPELEDQLTTWVPMDNMDSPGRLDAVVWGLSHLMLKPPVKVHVG